MRFRRNCRSCFVGPDSDWPLQWSHIAQNKLFRMPTLQNNGRIAFHWKKTGNQASNRKMLRNRITEPSTSKFASPIVLFKRGSNKNQWRFTVDYRQIKAMTENELAVLPTCKISLILPMERKFTVCLTSKVFFPKSFKKKKNRKSEPLFYHFGTFSVHNEGSRFERCSWNFPTSCKFFYT